MRSEAVSGCHLFRWQVLFFVGAASSLESNTQDPFDGLQPHSETLAHCFFFFPSHNGDDVVSLSTVSNIGADVGFAVGIGFFFFVCC